MPEGLETIISTAMTSVQTGILASIEDVIPVAIVVFSAVLAFKYAKKVFLMVTGR